MSESSKEKKLFFSILLSYYTIKKEGKKGRPMFANVEFSFFLFSSRVIHFDVIREKYHTIYFSIDNR
jgi:hypothetical protein